MDEIDKVCGWRWANINGENHIQVLIGAEWVMWSTGPYIDDDVAELRGLRVEQHPAHDEEE